MVGTLLRIKKVGMISNSDATTTAITTHTVKVTGSASHTRCHFASAARCRLNGGSVRGSRPLRNGEGLSSVGSHAFARAGILGNPSDVYFGRVLSVVIRDFKASVSLEESSHLRIGPLDGEEDVFRDIGDLAAIMRRQGYYGGERLIKAAITVFHQDGINPSHRASP